MYVYIYKKNKNHIIYYIIFNNILQYNSRSYRTISRISFLFWILWGLKAFLLLEELRLCPKDFFFRRDRWVMVGPTRKFQDSRQTHVFKIGSWAFIFKTCCNFEPANTYPNWEQPLFKYCKQQGGTYLTSNPRGMGICLCTVLASFWC